MGWGKELARACRENAKRDRKIIDAAMQLIQKADGHILLDATEGLDSGEATDTDTAVRQALFDTLDTIGSEHGPLWRQHGFAMLALGFLSHLEDQIHLADLNESERTQDV